MTRVSPSIAERCRLFSNVSQEESAQNFRRLLYQDIGGGPPQQFPPSGIPVPIGRKEQIPCPPNNGTKSNSCGDIFESPLYRMQRKLRPQWGTAPNNFRTINNGGMNGKSYRSYNGQFNEDLKQSLDSTATMNFSAEEVTTTADETDESKTDSRSPSPHRRDWGPSVSAGACSLPLNCTMAECTVTACSLVGCTLPACSLPSCTIAQIVHPHMEIISVGRNFESGVHGDEARDDQQPPAWTAVVQQSTQVFYPPDYRNSCPSIIEGHSSDKKPLRFITSDKHPLDLTSETETSDTNTGSYDYRLFNKSIPFQRAVHYSNDSGNECGTAFSPYQSIKKKSLYEFSDTALSEDDQMIPDDSCNGFRCHLSSCVSSSHGLPTSQNLANESSRSTGAACVDRPTSTTTVIQRSQTTANTPTNVDMNTPTPTVSQNLLNSSDCSPQSASDKDSIIEETMQGSEDIPQESHDDDSNKDNPGPRLSWSPKPSKKRLGRGRNVKKEEGNKCPLHQDEKLPETTGVACTCSSTTKNNTSIKGGRKKRDVSPSPSLGGLFGNRTPLWNGGPGQESPPPGVARREAYRRSISLGQILQNGGGAYRGALTSAGSSDVTPDTDGRELSDFEKENLLFIKDLDNSYHHEEPIYAQPYDTYQSGHPYGYHGSHPMGYQRPLVHSGSNNSLQSAYSDESFAGESTPRGGSPLPSHHRRHKLYSPSRAQTSYLIRSVSREEDNEEEEEVKCHPAYRNERPPGARARIGGTQGSSLPIPGGVNSSIVLPDEGSPVVSAGVYQLTTAPQLTANEEAPANYFNSPSTSTTTWWNSSSSYTPNNIPTPSTPHYSPQENSIYALPTNSYNFPSSNPPVDPPPPLPTPQSSTSDFSTDVTPKNKPQSSQIPRLFTKKGQGSSIPVLSSPTKPGGGGLRSYSSAVRNNRYILGSTETGTPPSWRLNKASYVSSPEQYPGKPVKPLLGSWYFGE